MNNKEIARQFDLLAKLMELHDENPFKIRSYSNAYLSLRKLEGDLNSMNREEIEAIPGVGSAIADKIRELTETGSMKTLEKYASITPSGVQEMLGIRGIGPKKVKQLWKELSITTVGDLLYACNENRLVEAKGFGIKTQEDIRKRIEFFMGTQGKFLYSVAEKQAEQLMADIKEKIDNELCELTGGIRRKMPEVIGIEVLSTTDIQSASNLCSDINLNDENNVWEYKGFPVIWKTVTPSEFYLNLFRGSASETFLDACGLLPANPADENEIFSDLKMQFIPPEYRESPDVIFKAKNQAIPELIDVKDIRGILHNHSTYSDGLHTLRDMADYVKECGYEYFLISDHSRSAFYAQGLEIERVFMQFKEIDEINTGYGDFKVFKGIESDILNDGTLDYPDDVLTQFDIVIASVHSNLNMDKDKATARIIKAVENPYTRILGHPTGRLLLAREGYSLDHKKVIDACAANNVVLELNANPQRLDIDWTWIPYAIEKGVKIAINPDAHSKESIHYVKFGVYAGRKGGLTSDMCLNTSTKSDFENWIKNGK